MSDNVTILGAGLAGSEAALQLADRGFRVRLVEMRPGTPTPVHATGACAELVCSNSLKSTKPESAAGMLKAELDALGSHLLAAAHRHAVPAGCALAVDREAFARDVTALIEGHPLVDLVRGEAASLAEEARGADALVVATGPLTSGALAADLARVAGAGHLAFYDAAAPIVMADSLDGERLFRQSRYEDGSDGAGDYLNAPFTREEYEAFAAELVAAERVVLRDFETRELFQACQPIEEIARKGLDAPRFGPLKPVGLTDPRTGKMPYAVLQLRQDDAAGTLYNLVGFQTRLKFPEQRRVFGMIPALAHAEYARYGVMHRNTFLNSPTLLDDHFRFRKGLYFAGQMTGVEGYIESAASGMVAGLSLFQDLRGRPRTDWTDETVLGAMGRYVASANRNFQPMNATFGLLAPLAGKKIRVKKERYAAIAARSLQKIGEIVNEL